MQNQFISHLPVGERPREKLMARGSQSLSDLELLAVILGRGARGTPVLTLARQTLAEMDRTGIHPNWRQLREITGVGSAKAAQLCAVMEFARRRICPAGSKLGDPLDVLPLVRYYADRKQEHFLCISLNGANEVIATRVVTVGLLNQSQVHPREVFADPITDRAAGIIVAHNHPSGSVSPSSADHEVTQRLVSAGKLLGIPLLDHLIFSRQDFFSFAREGLL